LTKEDQPITAVLQKRGFCASKSPTAPSQKPLAVIVKRYAEREIK